MTYLAIMVFCGVGAWMLWMFLACAIESYEGTHKFNGLNEQRDLTREHASRNGLVLHDDAYYNGVEMYTAPWMQELSYDRVEEYHPTNVCIRA